MHPYENLTTHRLTLRQLKDEDQQAIFELRSSEVVGQYIDRPLSQHSSEATAFIERIKAGYASGTIYYWALCRKEDQQLIGTICLWNFSASNTVAEIGYEMLPQYFGKGYMQEALAAVIEYSFNSLKLTAIEAHTHRDNASSISLLKRNGFILHEGRKDPDAEQNVMYVKTIQ